MRILKMTAFAVLLATAATAETKPAAPPQEPTTTMEVTMQDLQIFSTQLSSAGAQCDAGNQFACLLTNPNVRGPLLNKINAAAQELQKKAKK